MARHNSQNMGPYNSQEFPATQIAEALGLSSPQRDSYDYRQTVALKERLVEVCTHCAIRFGLPDQARAHIGDAIGLPNEPVLRYPHREIPIDARWEALANALRFPPHGHLPLVNLEVANLQALQAIKDELPSLLQDLGLTRQPSVESSARPVFTPIQREVGDKLVDKLERVKSFGDEDTSEEGYNRAIARNIHRQMRLYLTLGPSWTLVSSLENLALSACALPTRTSKTSSQSSNRNSISPEPLHSKRRDPLTLPPQSDLRPFGLTWKWTEYEGKFLPPAWGGPQQKPWRRWEPQFPDTDKQKTSLFGHSSVYLEIDLESQTFRDRPTKNLLRDLREIKREFEASRREARRDGYFSEHLEKVLVSRLIKDQDEALDSHIRKAAR